MPSSAEIAGRMRMRARKLANELGYDVHKVRTEPAPPVPQGPIMPTAEIALVQLFETIEPRVVIDAGANIGQFASWVRGAGFTGTIVSFEPQPAEHGVLTEIAEPDPDWIVAPRCALGASEGSAQLHLAGNSQSSSLLEMLERHSDNAPTSVYVDSVETPVRRLDDVLAELGIDAEHSLLKIDTQGFEVEVLRGALKTLPLIAAAHVEISLAPLYSGQALTSEIFALLAAAGLELSNVNDGFRSLDGRLLQIDGSFTRKAAGN